MLLDAGVLVSIDRGERSAHAFVAALDRSGTIPHTTHTVVAQVWRAGARQSRLARFLRASIIHPFDDGRTVGTILARTGTSDVVDAHLVAIAARHDLPILTGDPSDIDRLADLTGLDVTVFSWP